MAFNRTITSANARLTLTVPGVFPVPSNIQQFGTDEAFMVDNVDVAETMMGVDGFMSAGFVPVITPMTITLQASSPSIQLMELWIGAQNLAREILSAEAGLIQLPSLKRSYVFTNGVLKNVKQLPDAKKVLQPVQYVIHWERVQFVPLA